MVETWDGLHNLPALPLGNYRLRATGASRDPDDASYPYDTLAWEQISEPFAVVGAALDVEVTLSSSVAQVGASYSAPARGYRMLHGESAPETPTPLVPHSEGVKVLISVEAGAVEAEFVDLLVAVDGDTSRFEVDLSSLGLAGGSTILVTVDDGWGNTGSAEVTIP